MLCRLRLPTVYINHHDYPSLVNAITPIAIYSPHAPLAILHQVLTILKCPFLAAMPKAVIETAPVASFPHCLPSFQWHASCLAWCAQPADVRPPTDPARKRTPVDWISYSRQFPLRSLTRCSMLIRCSPKTTKIWHVGGARRGSQVRHVRGAGVGKLCNN